MFLSFANKSLREMAHKSYIPTTVFRLELSLTQSLQISGAVFCICANILDALHKRGSTINTRKPLFH